MITDNSETILLRNRCVCNWKLIPRNLFCVIGVYRKYLVEVPELHQKSPATKLCVTDGLCNGEVNYQMIKCVCNRFEPYNTPGRKS